jgi:RNA polymerase sigma factor (TIGR02999 family)
VVVPLPASLEAPMTEVTRILSALEQGDSLAAEQLLPLVYDELRQLAAQRLAHERPGQTLQATALVHEAYLRLVDVDKAQHFNSRGHFFAAAAEAMRRILIDQARQKQSQRKAAGANGRTSISSRSRPRSRPWTSWPSTRPSTVSRKSIRSRPAS